MSTAAKPIADCSLGEIRAYAKRVHGLEIHHKANRATALMRLRGIWQQDWIEVDLQEVIPEDGIQEGLAHNTLTNAADEEVPVPEGRRMEDAYYRIKVEKSNNPMDKDGAVQVGVNGRVMLIPRGMPVEIRYPYVHVLTNAVRHEYYQENDDITKDMEMNEVQAYNFSIMDGPYWKDPQGERIAA